MDNQSQAGYHSPHRSPAHEILKFQMYYGWKECQRLGIPYEPESVNHSNVYVRTSRATENEVIIHYWQVDQDNNPAFSLGSVATVKHERLKVTAVKYSYPVEMTSAERKRLRAALRRRNR